MQHKIVHGKSNPYSGSIPDYSNDCPLTLLMLIANQTFPVSPMVIYISPCAPRHPPCSCVPVSWSSFNIPSIPVVICVPVSQSVLSLWVSRSSFIFPVSRCPGHHFRPGCHLCPGALLMVIANRTFLVSWSLSLCVSLSSFLFPMSRCSGRHLCPDVEVCNFVSCQDMT